MDEVLLLTPIPYLPLALLFLLVLPSVIPGRPTDLEGTSSILVSIEACLQIAGKTCQKRGVRLPMALGANGMSTPHPTSVAGLDYTLEHAFLA